MPFLKRIKPSKHNGIRDFDGKGQPLAPAYPPEYFGDMALHHKEAFFELLQPMIAQQLPNRLLQQLPSISPNAIGQPLNDSEFQEKFQGSYEAYFKAFFAIHAGELLTLKAEWVTGWHPHMHNREAWHLQYATNDVQRNRMMALFCPGTQFSTGSAQSRGVDVFTEEVVRSIGSSSVIKLGRVPEENALRQGRVVTWPQMFIWGAMESLTALEVFTAGCNMQLMLYKRHRSREGRDSKDAAVGRMLVTGRYGYGKGAK